MNDTPTPRTDAALNGNKDGVLGAVGRLIDHAELLERERAEARAQRDALAMSYGELIAAVRVNAMRGTFREATVEQIDGWLKPWVDKLAAKGETK
jgi:hypothetical protein